jgi:hypothetical protein
MVWQPSKPNAPALCFLCDGLPPGVIEIKFILLPENQYVSRSMLQAIMHHC